jgi:hypothetical protein
MKLDQVFTGRHRHALCAIDRDNDGVPGPSAGFLSKDVVIILDVKDLHCDLWGAV